MDPTRPAAGIENRRHPSNDLPKDISTQLEQIQKAHPDDHKTGSEMAVKPLEIPGTSAAGRIAPRDPGEWLVPARKPAQ